METKFTVQYIEFGTTHFSITIFNAVFGYDILIPPHVIQNIDLIFNFFISLSFLCCVAALSFAQFRFLLQMHGEMEKKKEK